MCKTGSCSSCTQVLNVVSVPLAANDTNSVDLTLTGSVLTADVILKPTDSSLVVTPTGLSIAAPTKTATNECGTATTDATVKHSLGEIVKDTAGKLWATIPTDVTKVSSGTGTFTYTAPGAIPVTNSGFASVVANGTVISSAINTVTYTNPDSCRSMNLTMFLEWNRAMTIAQINSFMSVRHQVYVDLGSGTLTLVASDDTRRSSSATSTISESSYGARMANVLIAPGASVTLRLQTVTTMISSSMAVGSASDSNVFAQLKIVDGGTV